MLFGVLKARNGALGFHRIYLSIDMIARSGRIKIYTAFLATSDARL